MVRVMTTDNKYWLIRGSVLKGQDITDSAS